MEFEWNDDRVLKFARICTQGSYGDYANCRNAEQKLARFKEREAHKTDTQMRRKVSELSVKEKELYDKLSIELKDIKKSIRNSSRKKTSSLMELKEHFDRISKAAELMHEINKIIYNIKWSQE